MAEEVLQILAYCVLAGMGVSLVLWFRTSVRLSSGGTFLPLVPRRRVVWDHVELLITFGSLILVSLLSSTLLRRLGIIEPGATTLDDLNIESRTTAMLVGAFGQMLVTGAFLLWVNYRSQVEGVPFNDRGQWWKQLRMGLVAALMLIPPTMLIQVLVTRFYPYSHDLLEMVKEGMTPFFCLVALITGVIVAPISKEVFFRMLVQGWLESAAGRSAPEPMVIIPDPVDSSPVTAWEPRLETPSGPLAAYEPARYSPSLLPPPPTPIIPPLWPILVSSGLFAMAHLGQGPAPIPLFFLSLGLGYVYRQTHSIIPCIIVHFCLNAMSLTFAMLSSIAAPSVLPAGP